MDAAEGPERKRCPKCQEADTTTFSSCRYCGCKYDYKPRKDPGDINVITPMAIVIFCILAAYGGYKFFVYQQAANTPVDTQKLVGKILKSQGAILMVAATAQDMLSFDNDMALAEKNDPKAGAKGVGGILAAASALDNLNNNKDNSYSIVSRYVTSGQLTAVRNGDNNPLSVIVIGSNKNPSNFPIVQVRVTSGPQAGSAWWTNADQLETPEK